MVSKNKIDKLVAFINEEIERRLGKKLDCAYLVGSYAQGKTSPSRPDVNWLLIHKDPVEDISRWVLGEILTEATDKFISDFVVRSEPRPFKFSYPLKDGEDVFVNISIVTNDSSPEAFKHKNSFLPEYIFEGYKSSRKLVFGEDILKNINFSISKKQILTSAMGKIIDHKIQLDRIPLAYHLNRDISLIFNESLSHAKNLIYFGVELIMTDGELKRKKFLEYFQDKEKLVNIYRERMPHALQMIQNIIEAKNNYSNWKKRKGKAKEIYLVSSAFCNLLLYSFLKGEFNDK